MCVFPNARENLFVHVSITLWLVWLKTQALDSDDFIIRKESTLWVRITEEYVTVTFPM